VGLYDLLITTVSSNCFSQIRRYNFKTNSNTLRWRLLKAKNSIKLKKLTREMNSSVHPIITEEEATCVN
jgi:hypothetical protein